jgi:hypothetical protein
VNSLVVSNYTPEAASELPVIGVYYTFNIFLVAIALSGSVLVLKLHFRGHKLDRVPDWLLKLFFIKPKILKKQRSNSTLLNLSRNRKKDDFRLARVRNSDESITVNRRESLMYCTDLIHNCNRNNNNELINKNLKNKNEINDFQIEKVTKLLRSNFKKYDEERMKHKYIQEVLLEWRELARRMDYLFLVISLFVIICTPTILFGEFIIRDIKPLTNRLCTCENSYI